MNSTLFLVVGDGPHLLIVVSGTQPDALAHSSPLEHLTQTFRQLLWMRMSFSRQKQNKVAFTIFLRQIQPFILHYWHFVQIWNVKELVWVFFTFCDWVRSGKRLLFIWTLPRRNTEEKADEVEIAWKSVIQATKHVLFYILYIFIV